MRRQKHDALMGISVDSPTDNVEDSTHAQPVLTGTSHLPLESAVPPADLSIATYLVGPLCQQIVRPVSSHIIIANSSGYRTAHQVA